MLDRYSFNSLRLPLLSLALFLVFPVLGIHSQKKKNLPIKLPLEAEEKRDALEGLFALAESDEYPVEWFKHINSGEHRLRSIKIAKFPDKINGTLNIKIPPGIARAWSLFEVCKINGKKIDNLKVFIITPDGIRQPMKPGFSNSKSFSGKCRGIKIGEEGWKNAVIELKGTGSVNHLEFYSKNGISPTFDDRSWGVLGGDQPILPVKVNLLATTSRSIEGITTLELDKFRRLYCGIDGPPEQWKALEYSKSKGFSPGRQMLKLGPALEKAFGNKSTPKLKEDPNKKGWSDYSYFDKSYQPDEAKIKILKDTYPEGFEFATCLNYWPSWMELKNPKIRNDKGTPAVELFDSAGDLAARYIEAKKRKTGRVAKYWEVKNESDIKSEWMYHWEKGYDGWKLLADFHNKVAEAIKKRTPDVKVGGPTSAWPMFDSSGADGFGLARKNLTFMDRTRDSLDFYSHHFYESRQLIINDPKNENNYGGYLAGRLEGNLDLIRNHMILTKNIKPLIISETGTLMDAPDEISQWIKLKNYNSYMMRYMNRANEFRMIVPFLLPVTWWAKKANDTIFAYQPDGTIKLTKQHLYLDFWENYKGDLIMAETSTPNVFLHAVKKGHIIQLAINNMNPQRISVNINAYFRDAGIKEIIQQRLWLDRGKLKFENNTLKDLNNIPLSVEETAIIKITMDRPLKSNSLLIEKTFYGDRTLQKTGKPVTFMLRCPEKKIVSAKLRVCFGRNNGFNKNLSVNFNGEKYTKDLKYTDKKGRFFGYVEFTIPPNAIKESNQIIVDIPQSGGKISTVALDCKAK